MASSFFVFICLDLPLLLPIKFIPHCNKQIDFDIFGLPLSEDNCPSHRLKNAE